MSDKLWPCLMVSQAEAFPVIGDGRKGRSSMASKRTIRIPMKITVRRQVQVRTTSHVQSRRTIQSSSHQSFGSVSRIGPPGDNINNHFGDINTISGDGNQVAIGTVGNVTQLGGATQPIDAERLRATIRELQAVLPVLPVEEHERERLKEDTGALLDELDSDAPDEQRQRRLGGAIGEKLIGIGTAAAGGGIAQLVGKALLVALGLG
jgi:hypothetical protein